VRNFFSAVGVDFSTNNAANIGKAFIWNDKKGILTVRSTANDLDLIAAAIETLNEDNEAPPQVNTQSKYTGNIESLNRQPLRIKLKVRFAELTHSNTPATGFIWGTLGNVNVSQPLITNPAGSVLDPITDVPHDVSHFSNDVDHPAVSIGSITGILTPPQFDVAMSVFKKRNGVEPPTVPEVTTESGRPVRIPLGDSPFSLRPTNSIDPVLEVSPCVSKDGYFIEMTLIPTVPEFIDYVTNGVGASQMALPHYRLNTKTASVAVWDGQTVVLGFENGVSTNNARKHWMIFVTPTIINPDGTPFHTEKEIALELEKAHDQSIPPQHTSASGQPGK
jgi:hypothetical protein